MKTPDVTLTPIMAAVGKMIATGIGLAVAFGASVSDSQSVAIITAFEATSTVVALILVLGDAWIRGKRADNAEAIANAKAAATPAPTIDAELLEKISADARRLLTEIMQEQGASSSERAGRPTLARPSV